MPYGKYGVQLFFMLSGFVNAFTLLKKNPTTLDFTVGRAIRIVPTFWLLVVFNVLLLMLFPMLQHTVTPAGTAANLTVMPQLFGFQCMEPVTWTLMVEVLFYGFLAFALFTGRLAKPMLGMMMVAMGCSLVGCLSNQWIQQHYAGSAMANGTGFIEQLFILRWLPLFSMGILLNEIKMERGSIAWNGIGIFVGAVVFHVIDLKDHNPAATLILFALIGFSAYGKIPPLRIKPLAFIGSISYALYLFHNNLGTVMMSWMESMGVLPVISFVITTAFVVLLSAAITHWFDLPVTRFLRRQWVSFRSNRSQDAAAPDRNMKQMPSA